MKKKLFFALIIATLFVCIFAVSASAAVTGSTSNEYGDVKTVEGIDTVSGYDTTSRAVLVNADGTYTTYPAYYIYNGSTGTNMRLDFSKLNEIVGENYSAASLIRVEVFENAKLNWTYQNCTSLIDVYLPDGVYFHYASFIGCSALESITLPQTGVTQIPTDCFNGCIKLTSINIPDTVKNLGARAFQNCNALSVIKIPEIATGVIPQDFRKITNGKASTPVTYIVPKTCTGINSQYSINGCNVQKIIFTGTSDSAFIADVTNDYESALSLIEYANHCEYYYNNVHNLISEEGNTCCGICDRCGNLEMFTEPKHTNEWIFNGGEAISYTTAFTAEHICKFCQTVEDSQTIGVILYSDGISYDEKDYTGVYEQIKVNKIALETYATLSGQEFDYGIFALAAGEAETSAPITKGQDGKAVASDDKTVYASFTGTEYTYLRIKITGLSNGSSIFCGAYLIIGDNVIYVSNKQEGAEVAKYTMVTKTTEE